MSQRNSDYRAIPLCPLHHQTGGYGVAIHAGQKRWEELYGTEEKLLHQVREIYEQEYGEPAPTDDHPI